MDQKYSTLSAAIRAGSKLSGQCFNEFRDKQGRTCALGAANSVVVETRTVFEYAYDNKYITGCPTCAGWHCLASIIVCLNDKERWTREHIADWVEAWENKHLGYETLTESEVANVEPTAPLLLQQEAALQG